MDLVIIAAVAENGIIGRDGAMPWHYPGDLAHFKETTMGHPVVMGRVTFESIVDDLGGPLPGRTNVVLTTKGTDFAEGAVPVDSVDAALEAARAALTDRQDEKKEHEKRGRQEAPDTAYVAGGASVYDQFLPLADRLVLTEVHGSHEGDTYFPDVDWTEWTEVDRDDRDSLSFVVYERRE